MSTLRNPRENPKKGDQLKRENKTYRVLSREPNFVSISFEERVLLNYRLDDWKRLMLNAEVIANDNKSKNTINENKNFAKNQFTHGSGKKKLAKKVPQFMRRTYDNSIPDLATNNPYRASSYPKAEKA